ncbi:MAG: cyclic pyranopterin monophosphate synthase MoaC [Candidatus Omnitrophica bacterium]|nr:cyclic pyranopterin monophosphate synthase MoaC [Candidatus Aminicenantes bacterium]MBL7081882.1 cyclic pyranopterin monophosphate synthase MoaC [Candidatus Omnitrophota bacterium]
MKMVDVGQKIISKREAVVEGRVCLKPSIILAIKNKRIPKGDVLEAAKLAGILAAKKTPFLIPLCHPIPTEYVNIEFSLGREEIKIKTTVRARAKTGVEMEAFTATAISALTIYDMCKALDREITISGIRLLKKTGGKGGKYMSNLEVKG